MPATSTFPGLLSHLDTLSLKQGDEQTVALVVVNDSNATYNGSVCFTTSFPVRTEIGARPVTVRDESGEVIPSRLTESRLHRYTPSLPPGRVLWTLTLQFAAADVPAQGWRSYAATFGESPYSRTHDAAFWASVHTATPDLVRVHETDCHSGDLPLSGTYGIMAQSFGEQE